MSNRVYRNTFKNFIFIAYIIYSINDANYVNSMPIALLYHVASLKREKNAFGVPAAFLQHSCSIPAACLQLHREFKVHK